MIQVARQTAPYKYCRIICITFVILLLNHPEVTLIMNSIKNLYVNDRKKTDDIIQRNTLQ